MSPQALVIGEGHDALAIRARLDRLMPKAMEECARHLGDIPGETIVIDRLDLDIILGADAGDAAIEREWGLALTEAVHAAIRQAAVSGLALYRDEAEYLVAFLDDVVRGGGGSDWRAARPRMHRRLTGWRRPAWRSRRKAPAVSGCMGYPRADSG